MKSMAFAALLLAACFCISAAGPWASYAKAEEFQGQLECSTKVMCVAFTCFIS